jgi:adenylosuccinate lyase
LQLKKAALQLQKQLKILLELLWLKALENRGLLCVGRTHGQAAQPLSIGIKFLSHFCELSRGYMRFKDAAKECAVGKFSGAVGTYAYSSPEIEAQALAFLGLEKEPVATQIVARDRHAHYFSSLALIAGSLERLALELRLLMHGAIAEAYEPFSLKQQGSSAMPHKKNPILCENISGLMRLVRSYAVASLENQALWHERDISHSSVERVIAPDATNIMDFALERMSMIVNNLVLDHKVIHKHFIKETHHFCSQALMIALIDKGLARREAYVFIQEASQAPDFKQALLDKDIHKYIKKDELEKLLITPQEIENEALLFSRAHQILNTIRSDAQTQL